MPSTSSLLRSSASTRKKVLAQQDAEAEYEYSLGYKTYEDYREYDRYLDKRASSTTDPGQALTLQKRRNSAFRGYMSNEIQRQTIGVLEGRQSNVDKYNAMYQLYQNAISQGLYDQAQTLYLQLGNLDKTIQNEALAAASGAAAAVRGQVTAINDEVKAHETALSELGKILQAVGPDGFDKEIKKLAPDIVAMYPDLAPVFQAGGTVGFFDIANGIVSNIQDTYAEAISQLPPEEAATLQAKLDSIMSGSKTFKIPGVKDGVTFQDLQREIEAKQAGGQYFFRGEDGVLEKGKLTDYTWGKDGKIVGVYANPYSEGLQDNPYNQVIDQFDQSQVYRRDENGNYIDDKGKVVAEFKDGQITAPGGGEFKSEADRNAALKNASQSFETLLKEQGFNTVKKDGKMYVTVTEAVKARLGNIPGLNNGDPVEVVQDGQGNLRFVKKEGGKQRLYQMAFDQYGKANLRELQAGEQGAISARSLGDLEAYAKDLNKDYTGDEGIDAGNRSLVSTVSAIGQGVGYRYGVLADAEQRRRFLTGDEGGALGRDGRQQNIRPSTNPALRLNAAERAVKRVVSPIANPVRTAGQINRKLGSINPLAQKLGSIIARLRPSAGQRAANSSLAASRQRIQEGKGFKYGVLATEAGRNKFLESLR